MCWWNMHTSCTNIQLSLTLCQGVGLFIYSICIVAFFLFHGLAAIGSKVNDATPAAAQLWREVV